MAVQHSVSVIMPAYNAAKTIAQSLDSVLAQTCPAGEIIVIDDGSQDDTCEIVAGYGAKVRLMRKPNGGPASARNWGARLAQGDWFAMLDADDWWAPTKLAKQLTLADRPDVGLIHSLVNNSRPRVPGDLSFDQLWRVNWIVNSSVLIRRTAFEAVAGCVEDRALIGAEDYNLWLRLAANGWRLVNYPEVLTHYKRAGGLSANIAGCLAGELENLRLIGAQLGLSAEQCRVKRGMIYEQAGRSAFHQRQVGLARSASLQAFRLQPSLPRAAQLLVAHVPLSIANARRDALGRQPRVALPSAAAMADQSIFGRQRPASIDFGTGAPYLLVIVDAEEEFDWGVSPFASRGVAAMRHQDAAQRLFGQYKIVPTYAVDYAVAAQPDGYEPLRDYLADGHCEIGAQLHPWINPPIEERLIPRNSFPGNLPATLESAKLRVLTDKIEETLGCRPRLYRAGRYGIGANSAAMLDELGYQIDCSVVPFHNFIPDGGPDFRASADWPFWFGPGNRLLEIPVTVGMMGGLARQGRQLYDLIDRPMGKRLHLPGVMARLGLLDRVRLTPEGISLLEAKRMTRSRMQRDGQRVFVLSYHSPSLQAGNTPYVRNQRDLDHFIGWIEEYLAFFFGELGGMAATPSCIYAEAAFAAHPERLPNATSSPASAFAASSV